jgi:hypothetical protein
MITSIDLKFNSGFDISKFPNILFNLESLIAKMKIIAITEEG